MSRIAATTPAAELPTLERTELEPPGARVRGVLQLSIGWASCGRSGLVQRHPILR